MAILPLSGVLSRIQGLITYCSISYTETREEQDVRWGVNVAPRLSHNTSEQAISLAEEAPLRPWAVVARCAADWSPVYCVLDEIMMAVLKN
jgi:hypothetical protein